jgi:hypothetical protein
LRGRRLNLPSKRMTTHSSKGTSMAKHDAYVMGHGKRKVRKVASGVHPYAALEHRIIDSEAFADLKPQSVRLLMIICRQLTVYNNNGHLQATWSYTRKRGMGSENTLRAAIADLIAHGFVYRTKSRGPNKQWAKYAITWKSIKEKDGLYLDGFLFDAWKFWVSSKKAPLKKRRIRPSESDGTPLTFQQFVTEPDQQKLMTMN